jgi:hypothetical protein
MVFSKPFWEVLVRPVVPPFLLVALVDGALTVYGTSKALGGSPTFSLAAGLVVRLGVLIILLSTFDIWDVASGATRIGVHDPAAALLVGGGANL